MNYSTATKSFETMMVTPNGEVLERKTYSLMNEDEKVLLNFAFQKLNKFEDTITKIIINRNILFFNCIVVKGKPGSGKTYNLTRILNNLRESGNINRFDYISGKCSPMSLFTLLDKNKEAGSILFADDCDIFSDGTSQNLLKAAVDSKSTEKPRLVTYASGGNVIQVEFDGVVLLATNSDYQELVAKTDNPHLRAVLDRSLQIEMDLSPEDVYLINTFIIEQALNNLEYTEEYSRVLDPEQFEIRREFLANFFKTRIKELAQGGVFERAKLDYSIRFAQKVFNFCMLLGDEWTTTMTEMKRLEITESIIKNQPIALNMRKATKEEDRAVSITDAKQIGWEHRNDGWYCPEGFTIDKYKAWKSMQS